MLVVAEIKGKQYLVKAGAELLVDKMNEKEGATVTIDKVLLTAGDSVEVGMPYLENTSLKLKVLGDFRDKKVIVYKMKAKKRFQSNKSHRQTYTRVLVEEVSMNGKSVKAEVKATKPTKKAEVKSEVTEKTTPKKATAKPAKAPAKKKSVAKAE